MQGAGNLMTGGWRGVTGGFNDACGCGIRVSGAKEPRKVVVRGFYSWVHVDLATSFGCLCHRVFLFAENT